MFQRLLEWLQFRLGFRRSPPPPAFDVDTEFQRLAAGAPDIAALFASLGFDPAFEVLTAGIIDAMKALIRAEVDDFEGFGQAVEQAGRQMHASNMDAPGAGIRYRTEDRELFDAVRAALPDRIAVLEALNRDPVHDRLPFVEQLPTIKNGAPAWRTPIDHTFIRKRPSDAGRFEALLGELEGSIAKKKPGQVVFGIARLRRELARETAYLPTPLLALEDQVRQIHSVGLPAKRLKREELSKIIRRAADARHRPDLGRLNGIAREYLEAPWMRTRSLSEYLLIGLLDPSLATVTSWRRDRRLRAGLRLIRDEVATGNYDGVEIARRLRALEDRGLFTGTLVYRLLDK